MARRSLRSSFPRIPTAWDIERPELQELISDATRRPVCLVTAGAGWGKTTTLATWADRNRTAWLTLTAHDADPARFTRRLLAALQPHVPTLPVHLADPDPSGEEQSEEVLIEPMSDWFDTDAVHDIFIVLDDVHELPPESRSAGIVEQLCRSASSGLHVILVSRTEPPFSLERLRGQGMVAEIDAPRLAFRVDEVGALLQASIEDNPSGLSRSLHNATGGWPAATCLVAEMLDRVGPEHRAVILENVSQPGGRLRPYLIEEVLGPEPRRVRELLRRLTVLGEVTVPVGRDLGFGDADTLLPELARRGWIQPMHGRPDSWTLVPPLRDFFALELALSPGDRSALHRSIADLFVARESYGQALQHCIAAADHAAAVSLIVEHGSSLVETGEASAVLAAADLPERYLDDPRVQRVLGHAQQVRGQWASALECFRRASRDQEQLQPGLAWRMALIPFLRAEFGDALAMYARARLDEEDTADEALLLAWTASAYRMIGDCDLAREFAARALAATERCHDPSAQSASYTVLGMLAGYDGDRRQMDAYAVGALETAEIVGDALQILRSRKLRALHLVELGLAHEALTETAAALQLGEQCGYTPHCATALVHQGRAKAQLGRLEDALGDLTTARQLFQNMGSRLLAWPLCAIGDIHRRRGQLALARASYEEALALAETCHEVFGLSSALTGLARTRIADDVDAAQKLAEQAVTLGEGLREVQALLTRGWVLLAAGDRGSAADDAAKAAAAARTRGDNPGLAEALQLTVLASDDPPGMAGLLDEALQIWRELGHPIAEAEARLVAARITTGCTGPEIEAAERALQDLGVSLDAEQGAGPLAVTAPRAPAISIRTLGVFQVFRHGTPIQTAAWQSRKARDLLKILVARRRPAPREQLIELLWPDQDPAKTSNRLSVLLTTLRGVLAPDDDPRADTAPPLTTDGSVVWLDLDQVDVDAERFLAAAETALDAHAREEPDAIAKLTTAEALHTGEFLEDDPGQEWAAATAEDVRASRIAILRALVRRLRDAGDHDNAVRYALRLLQQDRYDEDAHLDLVAILVDARRLGEARRRYDMYRRQISELGIEPRPFPRPARPRTRRNRPAPPAHPQSST